MTVQRLRPSDAASPPFRARPLAAQPLRALLRRPLRVGIRALAVVTLTTLALTALVVARLAPQVSRADDVLSALQDGHVAMVNQETGLRGFLVTRDPQFLQPYLAGAASLQLLDARLTGWAAEDPGLAVQVAQLQDAEHMWITGWALPLQQDRPDVGDAAGLSALLLRGKSLFDDYRAVEAGLRATVEEGRDLAVHRQRNALLTGALVDLAVAGVVGLAVRRANRRLAEQLLPAAREVRDALAALAAGDLERRAGATGPAEFRDIAGDVNTLGVALRERSDQVAAREDELVAARD